MVLTVQGDWFLDKYGRKVLLRGVNLGGSSKVPLNPNGATHIRTTFENHREISFVGRPFPINEADEHFNRIKHWGFNCLRLLITWEAIEHKGPRSYDKEYLEYLEELLKIAENYKFYIFIDPHQDVWSRMTGGDGAPGWLFEKVGLDFTKFDAAEAAFVMQYRYKKSDPKAYPPMYWDNNNVRFANATMWTLFFGGKDFAPSCKIDGYYAQEYMQEHFFDSIKEVARIAKDFNYVIGFDSLNEPKNGWIGEYIDGSRRLGFSEVLGYDFTPFDAMVTAAGYPRKIGFREIKYLGIRQTREDLLNPNGVSCWIEGHDDFWRKEGVWDVDSDGTPVILNNEHFVKMEEEEVNFYRNYMSRFILEFSKEIHDIIPGTIIFFEGPEVPMMMGKRCDFDLPQSWGPFVSAAHWYDGVSVTTKRAWLNINMDITSNKFVIGNKKVQKMFTRQLKLIREASKTVDKGVPTLIGEFGLHYDLKSKIAYNKYRTIGDEAFKTNIKALSMYYNALDENLLNATQWNYTSDNNNEWGDQWNLEDLSIFSRDQQIDLRNINSGGRAIKGFCRPHFTHCSGIPVKMNFNYKKSTFYLEFKPKPTINKPTIMYIPKIQYPNGYDVDISHGKYEKDERKQRLKVYTTLDETCKLKIKKKK